MNPLSRILGEESIRRLREELARGRFPGVSPEHAMQFLLTDGVIPAPGLPVASFLRLEDWARSLDHESSVSYTASELKNKTGEILEQVLSGKRVRLLKHGRPIAEITRLKRE